MRHGHWQRASFLTEDKTRTSTREKTCARVAEESAICGFRLLRARLARARSAGPMGTGSRAALAQARNAQAKISWQVRLLRGQVQVAGSALSLYPFFPSLSFSLSSLLSFALSSLSFALLPLFPFSLSISLSVYPSHLSTNLSRESHRKWVG